jgi:hypothetical protein
MNTLNTRVVFCGLLLSFATTPALAAGESSITLDEGLPPNIAEIWKREGIIMPRNHDDAERMVPQSVPAAPGIGS